MHPQFIPNLRHPAIDLTGQTFNRWTVIERAENTPQGQAQWRCRCECGTERVLKSIVIRRGISQSCGCLKLEILRARLTKHGHSPVSRSSPTYNAWAGMVQRCTNPRTTIWSDYGGRGITVCERWLDFRSFLEDMGERPDGLTLDRIDNNRGYEPGNCRWTDGYTQANNRRNNVALTHNGETHNVSEWARILGIKVDTIHMRLRRGRTTADALSTTPLSRRVRVR